MCEGPRNPYAVASLRRKLERSKIVSRTELPGAKVLACLQPAQPLPINVQSPQNIWLAARVCAALVLVLMFAASSTILLSSDETLVNVRFRLAQLMFLDSDFVAKIAPVCTAKDGRFRIHIDRAPKDVERQFVTASLQHYDPHRTFPTKVPLPRATPLPPLNVTMLLVGSLGDVLPFVPIAMKLNAQGHRVRIATHRFHRSVVVSHGLDFYPLGGNPKFMVKHLADAHWFVSYNVPNTLLFLAHFASFFTSAWTACIAPDATGNAFRADAIIVSSHSPGFEHIAEWLQVPMHTMGAYPAAPTQETAHITEMAEPEWNKTHNQLSYAYYEAIPWFFLHQFINFFRWRVGLPEAALRPRARALIPHTYFYSTSLAPRFQDWGDHVDVVGVTSLNQSSNYTPPADLAWWLAAGPAPIYFGFGSMIIADPKRMLTTIIDSLRQSGQRGIIQSGWTKLGHHELQEDLPPNVFLLDYMPHDSLLPLCSAVVHHGGSGTTSAGLKAGLPTLVIPFILDQPFWGRKVFESGAGPAPIPQSELTVARLVPALRQLVDPQIIAAARRIADHMATEDGNQGAVDSFLAHLPAEFSPGTPCMPWRNAVPPEYGGRNQWVC